MTPEAIFVADPDVIIMGPWAGSVDDVYARPGWERLKAVREKLKDLAAGRMGYSTTEVGDLVAGLV